MRLRQVCAYSGPCGQFLSNLGLLFSCLVYIALYGTLNVNAQFETIWKEAAVEYFKVRPVSQHFLAITEGNNEICQRE
jgi:hypothetical protein